MTDVALYETLLALREAVRHEGEERLAGWRAAVRRERYLPSALNLACYLALRRRDLRELQEALMVLGLSSLGRCESRVLANLDAVLHTLAARVGRSVPSAIAPVDPDRFFAGTRLLAENAAALFGPLPGDRTVHVMATVAGDLLADDAVMDAIVAAGVRVVRINCAKDDPATWRALAARAREAGRVRGVPVEVAFDLCGPRARTGEVLASKHRRARVGDRILMTSGAVEPVKGFDFVVAMSLPEVLRQLGVGARVTIDEGALEAVVVEPRAQGLALEVTRAEPEGSKLKPNKGLNFPGTHLSLSPLTDKDLRDLDVVAREADLVGYSFVQTAEDVRRLHDELERRGALPDRVGVVAKIETALAIRNLPDIIVHGAGAGPFGVMIARGDLAVEIGYLRLAELQEELLWLCEAAHVPVIWATEVMSSLVRTGKPTRAEMTDAAMAERAECVMLNKGPYLPEAARELGALLGRMADHQRKKVSRLRALGSW